MTEWHSTVDFSGGSEVKNPLAKAGAVGLIPGSGRSSGEGSGNPPQYSFLGNSWQATAHCVAKSQTRLRD